MVKARALPPVVCSALGVALALYPLGAWQSPWRADLSYNLVAIVVLLSAAALSTVRTGIEFFNLLGLERFWFRRFRLGFRQLLFFFAGMLLGFAARPLSVPLPVWGIPLEDVSGLTGVVENDPRRLEDGRYACSIGIEAAHGSSGIRTSASGSIFVFLNTSDGQGLYRKGRGTLVRVLGTPTPDGRGFRAQGVVVVRDPSPKDRSRTEALSAAVERFNRVPWGGLATALLLGVRDNLLPGTADAFSEAGSAHVLSLSGMHLGVISALVAFALRKPFGICVSAVLGSLCIGGYVAFVGPQASLLRSLLMYLSGAAGILWGLPRRSLAILCTAFIFQTLMDPRSSQSLSFMLSYLALAGIIILAEPALDFSRARLPSFIAQPLAASVGAFVATAALVWTSFDSLRPIGMVVSLALVPATALLMVGGLLWFALDLVAPFFGDILSWALGFVHDMTMYLTLQSSRVAPLGDFPQGSFPELAMGALVLPLSLAASIALVYGRYRINLSRNRLDPFD